MNPLVISLQLANNAASQYIAFPFNSLAVFNGKVVMAGTSGIFTHEGQTDNGTEIDAYADLPFAKKNHSIRPRRIRVEGEGGDMDLTVWMDEANAQTYRVDVSGSGQKRAGTFCERVAPGANMTLRLANVEGSDFSVDGLDVVLIELARRV